MAVLLIVEDDTATNEAICEYMSSAGHTTLSALDGEQGLQIAREKSVDLVVLDIMLPKRTGLEVLKELRRTSSIPVLMLTALDDEPTQAASFDEQADDYITKPFHAFAGETGDGSAAAVWEKPGTETNPDGRYYGGFWRLHRFRAGRPH